MPEKTVRDAVDGALNSDHEQYQLDPDEEDPVCGETADEAWETYQRRGLVNPFHAEELQRRQRAARREVEDQKPSLGDIMLGNE